MQILKEEIKSNILVSAKNEFLQFGFEKASIRRIASASGTSASNLYNYFKSKDELFLAIVQPLIVTFEQMLSDSLNEKSTASPDCLDWHIPFINKIYALLLNFKLELILLFRKSKGSDVEDFKLRLADGFADLALLDIPDSHRDRVSKFFLLNFTMSYINFLENIAVANFDNTQIKKHLVELTIYSYGGINNLIENNTDLFDDIYSKII